MLPGESAQKFVGDTLATGGATMSQEGKFIPVRWEHDPKRTTHYLVGGARMHEGQGERFPTSVVSVKQFTPDLVQEHVRGMQSRGAAKGAQIGSWKQGGFVELDASSVTRGGEGAKQRAVKLMKDRNEKALFQTNPGQEIENPEYKETPSTATVHPMRGVLQMKQHMLEG